MIRELFVAPTAYVSGDMTIRAYRPGDGPALHLALASSYKHLRPWMPWARAEQSPEEVEAICRRFAGRYLLNEDFVLSAWIGGEVVGGTGYHLRQGDLDLGNAEVGMWISAAHSGRGLGTRLLAAMLAWGFTTWPWERLVWYCDARNLASERVAQKNGLVHEGTLRANAFDVAGQRRDTHIYALLRHEWAQRAG